MSVVGPTLPRSARLWDALSRPVEREPQAKGLDLVGAWVHGRLARRRYLVDRRERAEKIVEQADALMGLSERSLDEHIAAVSAAARLRPTDPPTVDAAYAMLREVVRRELGLALHVEQVMGALVMADGAAAEMATGEGKTVTAILPTALLGWQRRGVHVLTVNDYLAERDASIVRGVLGRVGLGVGSVVNETPRRERRAAYDADVTYAADKQVVFDFLRDRLGTPLDPRLSSCLLDEIVPGTRRDGTADWHRRIVQRGLFAAVIDEADSVLIDEAVTPAIISADSVDDGSDEGDPGGQFRIAAELVSSMDDGRHYTVERASRHVELTDAGRSALAAAAARLPEFWSGRRRSEELIRTAITAKELMVRGDDYIVKDGTVEIVDRSTGRVLTGRRWQLGLHQAVEAKEGVAMSDARRTSARISYARFFQQYRRLAGMSGTLHEVRDELWRTYRLAVVPVPTHRPIARAEAPDAIHATEAAKLAAVAGRVEAEHALGRPILVGTRSVSASERVAALLAERGIECRVLNAERADEEASIIEHAGRVGAVTVATNMAGRGTDIKIDEKARELGGLLVIGTERHRERRVDRQLYGRAGRQGDPGGAEMHVCFDDDLIAAAGNPMLRRLATRFPRLRPWLWRQAQWTGSRMAAHLRGSAAAQEGWLELSLYGRSR
ncbi:MAG: hypothetical protein AAGF47_08435 [Planctomycetota bacterium]